MTRTLSFMLAALAAFALSPYAASAHDTGGVESSEIRLPHISIVRIGTGGTPLVLIPGLSTPRAVWDDFVPSLTARHTVYLVQVNGFAGDHPGANLGSNILEGIVADLHGHLRREATGPVLLVGHSMGGLAALLFARAYPGEVQRLLVVDALPFFSVLLANGGAEPTVAEAEPVARMMRDRVAATYGRPADSATIEANVRGLALNPASLERMRTWASATDPRVAAQLVYEDMTTDVRPHLPAIEAPIAVLVPWSEGGLGRQRTLAFYRRQYAGAPDISFEDVGEAGHFVMLDQPEAFRAALDRFLLNATEESGR